METYEIILPATNEELTVRVVKLEKQVEILINFIKELGSLKHDM